MATGNSQTIPEVGDDVAITKNLIGPQISPVNYAKDSDKIQSEKRAFSPLDSEDEEGPALLSNRRRLPRPPLLLR